MRALLLPFRLISNAVRTMLDPLRWKTRKSIFASIYRGNLWAGAVSASGPGSDLKMTESIRRKLPTLLRELQVRSLLDAPCGDFHWMNLIDLPIDSYTGVDIVPELAASNQVKYGKDKVKFLCLDICRGRLPQADMILCRDALIHFSNRDVLRAVENFKKSGAKYLATTDHPQIQRNDDILTGAHRRINFQLAPFEWPKPIASIAEDSQGVVLPRNLSVWKLQDI